MFEQLISSSGELSGIFYCGLLSVTTILKWIEAECKSR
jgi:hypothetical protein